MTWITELGERLGRWLSVFVTCIISRPMGIAAVGPDGHLVFVHFAISPLQYRAELGKIALDLLEVLRRNLLPLRFQRSPQLVPKLPELFLIHHLLLG